MDKQKLGFIQALTAFSIWGLFPVYFKFVATVPSLEVILYRLAFSFPVMLIILIFRSGIKNVWQNARASLPLFPMLFLTGIIISVNWLGFVWAVSIDKVIETSLGYFISPLFTIFFSLVFFHERLPRLKQVALVIAVIAVTLRIIQYGQFPVIAITVGFTFSLYGLLKKISQKDSRDPSLFFLIETALLFPFAAIILLLFYGGEMTLFQPSTSWGLKGWILGMGIVTVYPLILFNEAVQKVNLSKIGFLQYIVPSLSFLLAIGVYQEPFTIFDLGIFAMIWTALALIIIDDLRGRKAHKKISRKTITPPA